MIANRRGRRKAGWFVVSWCFLAHSAVLAQQPETAAPKPADGPALEVLRAGPEGRTPTSAVAPPPVTPPTILATEAQPIDLTTALELANVQNPEFNVAPAHP